MQKACAAIGYGGWCVRQINLKLRIGARGRESPAEQTRERYSFQRISDQYLRLYRSLIKDGTI